MDHSAKPSAKAAPIVTLQIPYPPAHSSGVLPIDVTITVAEPNSTGDYQLELMPASDGRHAFHKRLTLEQQNTPVRVIVNTHLLDNGTAHISAALRNHGNVVWNGQVDFAVNNAGPLASKVAESMRRHGTPLILDGLCDSSYYDYRDTSLLPWFDQPNALELLAERRRRGEISDTDEAALRQFVTDGYLIVPEQIEDELIDQANAEIDDAVAKKWQGYTYGSSQRLEQLHQTYPGIRKIWQHPTIFRHLQLIFGVPARPCQTLVYLFGSQQDEHQDSIHLTPFPAGYMCGVWIPLEDVDAGSGELAIYPGSHRLPRLKMKDVGCPKVKNNDWSTFGQTVVPEWKRQLASREFVKVPYLPKRGTVLIWHENLMHAGSPRTNLDRTRRSVVIHSFAEGAVAYYDSTGMPGIVFERE